MATWFDSFMRGYDWGSGIARDYKLREGLASVDKMKVEEKLSPQSQMLAEQDEGLTTTPSTPRTVQGYKFGERDFSTRPPDEYLDALKAQQRAGVYEQYGDPETAAVLRRSALKERAGAIQNIIDRAFSVGTPDALVGAFELIDNGQSARLEPGEGGARRLMMFPTGQPDKAAEVFAGNDAAIVDFARKQINPKLAMELADAEAKRGDYKDREWARQEAVRQRDEAIQLRQIDGHTARLRQVEAQLNNATTPEQVVALNRERDDIEKTLSSLYGGLVRSSGGTGAVSGGEGGLHPTAVMMRPGESGNRMNAVSSQGATGPDQIMPARLADYNKATGKSVTMKQLKTDSGISDTVANWHYADIDNEIRRRGLGQFVGQNVRGQTVTMPGMQAVAHLGHVNGLEKYLRTGGQHNPPDRNGTRLSDYMKKYANYSGPTAQQGGLTAPGKAVASAEELDRAKQWLADRNQKRYEGTMRAPSLDDWLSLRTRAEEVLSGDPKFGELKDVQSREDLINKKAAEMWRGFAGSFGGFGGGLGAGQAGASPFISALEERRGAASGSGGSKPTTLPKTGEEAVKMSQARNESAKRQQDARATMEGAFESAMSPLGRTGLGFQDVSKEAVGKKVKDAIDAIKGVYANLSDRDKARASQYLDKLTAIAQ